MKCNNLIRGGLVIMILKNSQIRSERGGSTNFQFFQNSKKSKLSWGSGSGKLYTFSTFLSFRLMWRVTKSARAYDLEAEILALFQNLTIFGFPKKGNKL